ncbi:MAG: ABC transporter permease [Alphaproteobacteria bacterium]|nr:ABC transporter permease [Alphaproteobacteria bacterium]
MNFWQYLVKRLLHSVPVFIGISLVVFSLIHLIPGDPAIAVLGEQATDEEVNALREEWHLNDPLWQQFGIWLLNIVQGDLGRSLHTNQPVSEIIASRLPATAILSGIAIVVSLMIAIPIGIISALKRNSWIDHVARVVAMLGVSIPNFWLGIVFIIIFAVHLGWLPPGGYHFSKGFWAGMEGMILPAVALGAAYAAITTRMMRSSMLEVLRQEYIETARAKGLTEPRVIRLHAVKNAIIPTITVIGMQIGYLLSGAVLTETIFFMPGVGRELITALSKRDFPIIQGLILFFATVFVVTSIIVDLSYAFFNPKIEYS